MNKNQLISDIKTLESAGKIKEAQVLRNRLNKESQFIMSQMPAMYPQVYPQMTTVMPQAVPQVVPQMMVPVQRSVVNPGVTPAPMPIAQPMTTPVQTIGVTPPVNQYNYPPTAPPTNKQIRPPYTGTTPIPNPLDNTQRGYGNQQSKDQEMQYLQNELKRLQDQYGESCGPFAAQCNTIRDMIQRNQGGNVIRKSTNMNKFEKLAKLNQDIEILENAGKFKAAEILQKKFLKEAQLKSARDLMTELNLLVQNPNQDFDNLVKWWGRNYVNYSPDDQVLVNETIKTAKSRREKIGTFSTSKQPENPTLSSFETAVPAVPNVPNVQTQNSDPTAPIGRLSDQVQAEQADFVTRGVGNVIQTGKENMDIQAKYRMTPQENEAENQLYSSTINEIKKLLATGNETQRNYARGLYQNTRQKFKNLKRQYLYDQQYAAIERNPNKKQ